MRVFISWSGDRSKAVAEALRRWLPRVLQPVRPWTSSSDIAIGTRWEREIAIALADTEFGVLCITSDNHRNAWLVFEAGAVARSLPDGRVSPYLLDVPALALRDGPLSQFQATSADRDGTLALIKSLNDALGAGAISAELLHSSFDQAWPDLENTLRSISAPTTVTSPKGLASLAPAEVSTAKEKILVLDRETLVLDLDLDRTVLLRLAEAQTHKTLGNYEMALPAYTWVDENTTDNWLVKWGIAFCLQRLGRPEAMATYQALADKLQQTEWRKDTLLTNLLSSCYNQMSAIHEAAQANEQAYQTMYKAHEIQPGYIIYIVNLMGLAVKAEREKEAKGWFDLLRDSREGQAVIGSMAPDDLNLLGRFPWFVVSRKVRGQQPQ